MKESEIYNKIKKELKRSHDNVIPVRLENSVASGLPDVVILSKRAILLELKTGKVPKLREKQIIYFSHAMVSQNPYYFILSHYHPPGGGDKYLLFFYSSHTDSALHTFKVRDKENRYRNVIAPCVLRDFTSIEEVLKVMLNNS